MLKLMIIDNLDLFSGLVRSHSDNLGILCGAGVSVPSGVPSAEPIIRELLGRSDATAIARSASSGAIDLPGFMTKRFPDGVPLRFEGLMEIVQRFVDPQLGIIDQLFFGEGARPRPNWMHLRLGELASALPVVTTNLDVLIEEASGISTYDSIVRLPTASSTSWATLQPFGLWKIHGTTRKYQSGWIADHEAGPAATLATIARSRHDEVRHALIQQLLNQRALLVIGYSGSDDFDISEWLTQLPCPSGLLWVAYKGLSEIGVALQHEARSAAPGLGPIHILDMGRWTPAERDHAIGTLLQSIGPTDKSEKNGKGCSDGGNDWDWKRVLDRWVTSAFPSELHRRLFAAEVLKHVSQYQPAILILDDICSAPAAGADKALLARTHLSLAEALVEPGYTAQRSRALVEARRALALIDELGLDTLRADARLAYSKALVLQTNASRADQVLAIQLLTAVIDGDSTPLEKARAATNAYRFGRTIDRQLDAKVQNLLKEAEKEHLSVEALSNHENAKRVWSKAENPMDLCKYGADILEKAVKLREQVGDTDGYCASTNVLATTYLALSDWFDWQGDTANARSAERKAFDFINRSERVAEAHDLQFPKLSAATNSALYCVCHSHDPDRLSSAERSIKKARSLEGAQTFEWMRLDYIEQLLLLAKATDLATALADAINGFLQVVEHAERGGRSEAPLLGARAKLNADACRMLLDPSSRTDFRATREHDVISARGPFFRAALENLARRLPSIVDGNTLARTLLKPLPSG